MSAIDKVEWFYATRRAHRARQSQHLQKCGPRPILEALLACAASGDVDSVLADFCRLEPETYHACLYFYGGGEDEQP